MNLNKIYWVLLPGHKGPVPCTEYAATYAPPYQLDYIYFVWDDEEGL